MCYPHMPKIHHVYFSCMIVQNENRTLKGIVTKISCAEPSDASGERLCQAMRTGTVRLKKHPPPIPQGTLRLLGIKFPSGKTHTNNQKNQSNSYTDTAHLSQFHFKNSADPWLPLSSELSNQCAVTAGDLFDDIGNGSSEFNS